jgi:competence protein ComEA
MRTLSSRLVALALALGMLAAAAPAAADPAGQVNINTATAAELALLPYVGEAIAQRIVEHRTKNGAFKAVEDLMLVRGIGEKSFERIKPYVTVSGKTSLTESVRQPRAAKPASPSQAG